MRPRARNWSIRALVTSAKLFLHAFIFFMTPYASPARG